MQFHENSSKHPKKITLLFFIKNIFLNPGWPSYCIRRYLNTQRCTWPPENLIFQVVTEMLPTESKSQRQIGPYIIQVLQQSSLKEGCCISGSCGRQHIFGSTIWSVSHQNEMAIDHFWCQGNYLNADKQQYECKTLKYKTKKSLRQLRSKTGGSLGENDNFPVMPGHLPFLENCHLATLLSKIWLYNWR